MRGLFLLVALSATVLATGCTSTTVTSVGCTLETTIDGVAAMAVAQELQCSNQAAIVTSIQGWESSLKICSSTAAMSIGKPRALTLGADGKALPMKSVGGDLCTSLGTAIVSGLASGVVPAAWGCTSANATTQLSSVITTACNKAFP